MKNFKRYLLFFLVITITILLLWCKLYDKKLRPIAFKDIKLEDVIDKKNIVPVAIIGSGPAGLSAALYSARSAYYTVVFQGPKPGGQLIETTYVENWPGTKKMLGSELIDQNRKQAQNFGAFIANEVIEYVDFSTWPFRLKNDEGQEIYALSVIIATGANPRILNVPGEKEYWAFGVTTCAVCDAPFYKDKDVVVVGGGDSAIEEATLLASYAKNVKILVRSGSMRAAPAMQERLKGYTNIQVMYNTSIIKILGDNNYVNEIEIRNNKDNSISKMPIDGVFLAIGHEPNSQIFKEFLPMDELGYIKLDTRTQKTVIPGVFAAGDVADHRYRQAGTAAGFGIMAALDAVEFLQNIGFNDAFSRKIEKNYYDPDQGQKVELKKLVTINDLDKLLKEENKPLVIDVGAEYCPSCKILLPVVQSVAAKLGEKINFAQVDLGDDPKDLQKKLDLKTIPTLLIYKDGKLISRYESKMFTKRELYSLLNQLIE